MYAKSMLAYARAQVVAGAYEKQFRFVPVILAWLVAALPFTMELRVARFSNSPSMVEPEVSSKPRGEPLAILENPFRALMQAHAVVEPPKRAAMPLDSQQRAVTSHITRKYGVSTEVVGELVRTAYAAGKEFGIDPLLVVAIMAVESSFNPIAESVAGAKGLMQVIPEQHQARMKSFGIVSVLEPGSNILVGSSILRDCIRRAGGVRGGLQLYAGAYGDPDASYAQKVMAERARIENAMRQIRQQAAALARGATPAI